MKKNQDDQNRWRNKVVAFRMSPEEAEQLNALVKLSGYSKQDYIISKLLDQTVVVQGNPRVYKALRDTMGEILSELTNLNGTSPSADLLATITHIVAVMEGLKGGEENAKISPCPARQRLRAYIWRTSGSYFLTIIVYHSSLPWSSCFDK